MDSVLDLLFDRATREPGKCFKIPVWLPMPVLAKLFEYKNGIEFCDDAVVCCSDDLVKPQTLKLTNEKHLVPDWGGKQRDERESSNA